MFHVLNLRTGEFWPDPDEGGPMYFVTAPEAQTAEANLNACTAVFAYYPSTAHLNIDSPVRVQGLDTAQTSRRDKWQIRPAPSAACENWRDRENNRFAMKNGYKEVPWADHPAWKELLKNEPHASHFLHISTQDEVYISFTPNDEYGKFDRQLKITPMRYFKKHCPGVLSAYINEWMKKWVVTNNHHTIFYARTSDEIRRVYENGPPSCMSHKRSRFWGDGTSLPHPSEAYAGGDLAIAYITRNISGCPTPVVTSRVVVWPDKKVMGPKVYGTDAHLLRMLLEDEGYESKKGGFHGARLLKIYYPREHVYIMPYIDGAKILLTTEGEIVFNSDDGVDASATNGTMTLRPPFRSDKTGCVYYHHKVSKITVYLSDDKKETWAKCELTEDVYQCAMTGNYYKSSYLAPVRLLANSVMCNVNEQVAKQIKTRCGFYEVPTTEKTYKITVGYRADGTPIHDEWSCTAASNHSFEHRGVRYAEWLCSLFKMHVPFIAEHLYIEGLEPYQITEEINRENAISLMRVVKNDSHGKMVFEYPSAKKKPEEGKTPILAQKKIGSGVWGTAFPPGKVISVEDDDEVERKKKGTYDELYNQVASSSQAVNVYVPYMPLQFTVRRERLAVGGAAVAPGGGGGAGGPGIPIANVYFDVGILQPPPAQPAPEPEADEDDLTQEEIDRYLGDDPEP